MKGAYTFLSFLIIYVVYFLTSFINLFLLSKKHLTNTS
nr:MAG TPA: hypothetical protein [Caudoviricetes sp.]